MHHHLAVVHEEPETKPPVYGPGGNLCAAVEDFLNRCGRSSVLGPELAAILDRQDLNNGSRLHRLLAACGYADDAPGFFAELCSILESGLTDWRAVTVNGIPMPHALLLTVLETMEPGDRLIDVTSVDQLENLLHRPVPDCDRLVVQEVLDRFPVRLSQHALRQLRLSGAVGSQYLPFVDELSREGLVHTWVGQFHSGVIERMYRNRVIMVLNMSCPVYCRFCFRKHKECRQEPSPTRADVLRGVAYVRSSPEVTEVVLTGGDPFMNRSTLTCAVEGLLEVGHVQTLRLATRSLSYHPALFTQQDRFWMRYLLNARVEADRRGKRIEIATHFIHPDELSVRSLELIAELVSSGIGVYVQTPLLGGINDHGSELVELYQRLRAAGAEMHYVFMPCSPLQGNRFYQSTIDTGMRLAAYLRSHLSDRAFPRFCTATAFGKIDWGCNGWVVEEDPEDDRFLWLRTPYTRETFESFAPGVDLSGVARDNDEGTLDARFMVAVGDRRWLRGQRCESSSTAADAHLRSSNPRSELLRFAAMERAAGPGIPGALRRVHRARAELDIASSQHDMPLVLEQLAAWQQVSDVVVWSSGPDPLRRPRILARWIDGLTALPNVQAVRVRSRAAVAAPQKLDRRGLDILTAANHLGALAPLRIELELRILHASELTPLHRDLAARLRGHGVTVYANSLLLAGVNDRPQDVRGISSACRRYGIEFHHLIIAGDTGQQVWNAGRPISVQGVIDIASELRRSGSGRELPRYVVLTPLGEVDLGLTAEPTGCDDKGRARLRLLTFAACEEDSAGTWGRLPEGADVDSEGHPIVTIPGLTC